MGSGGGGEGGHLSVKIQLLYGQSVTIFGIMQAEAKFSLCELACEKQPLPTTVQFSIVHARNSSRDSQAKLIVRPVVKWREFRGNKKIATTLICYARLMQSSKPVKNRKKPVFFSSRFLDGFERLSAEATFRTTAHAEKIQPLLEG